MPRPHFQLLSDVAAEGIRDGNIALEHNAVSAPSSPPTVLGITAGDDEPHYHTNLPNEIDAAVAAAVETVTTSIEHGTFSSSTSSTDSSGFGGGISVSPTCKDLPACFGHKVIHGGIPSTFVTSTSATAGQHPLSSLLGDEEDGEQDAHAGGPLCSGPHTHSNTSFEPPNKASWSSSPPTRYIVESAEGAPEGSALPSPVRCSSPSHQLPCFAANIPSQHSSHPAYNVFQHAGSPNHHSSSTATANGSEAGIRFLLRKSALTSSTFTVSGSTPASTLANNQNGSVRQISPPHVIEYPSPDSCVPSPAQMDGLFDDEVIEDDGDELMPTLARCLSPNPHSPTAIPHPNFSSSVDDFGSKLTGMHFNGGGDSPASIPVSSRHFQSFLSFPHVSSKASSTTSSAAPEFSQLLSKFTERGQYGGSPSPRACGLQHTSPNLMRYTFSEGVVSRRSDSSHLYHPHPQDAHDGAKHGRAEGVQGRGRRIPGDNAFLSAAAAHHTVPSSLRVSHQLTGNSTHNDTLSESSPAENDGKLPAFQQCPAQKMRVTTTLHRFAATTPTFHSSDLANITTFYASGASGATVRGKLPATHPNQMDELGFGTTLCSSGHNPGSPRDVNSPQSPQRPPFAGVGCGGGEASPLREAAVRGSGEGSGYSIMIDGLAHHLPLDIRLPDATTQSSSDTMSTHMANLSVHDGSDLSGTLTTTCENAQSTTGAAQSQQHMEGWGHHAFATSTSTPFRSIVDSNPSSTRSPAGRVSVDAGFGRRLGLQVPAGLFQALAKANGTVGGGGGNPVGSPSLSIYSPPLYPHDGGHNTNDARCSLFSSQPSNSRHSIPSDGRAATEDLRRSVGDDDWGSESQETSQGSGGGLRALFTLPQHRSMPPLSPPKRSSGIEEDTSPLTKYGPLPVRGGSGWSVSSSTEASARAPSSTSTVPTIPPPAVQGGGSTTSDRWWGNSGSGGNTFLDFSLHNSLHRSIVNQPNTNIIANRRSSPSPAEAVSMIPRPLPLSRPVHLDVSPRGRGSGVGVNERMEDNNDGEHHMRSLFTVVSNPNTSPDEDHSVNSNHKNNQASARGASLTGIPFTAGARPKGVLPAMSTANPGRPLHSYNTGRFSEATSSMHLSGSIGPNFFNAPSNPNNNSSTGFNGSLPVFAGLSGRHPDSSRSAKSSTKK